MRKLLTAFCLIVAMSPCASFALDRTITVSGTAHVDVVPDYASVQIGVSTTGKTVAEALAKNGPAMKAVLRAIETSGVPRKDVRTESFEIKPVYQRLPNGDADTSRMIGYSADNEVNVGMTAMDKIGNVIDAAARAGATDTGRISFSLQNDEAVLNQVRAAAMRDARRKAEMLVAPEHKTVGELLVVGRGVSGLEEYEPRGLYSMSPVTAVAQAEMKFEGAQIVPGQVTISDTVTATFALQ